MRFPKRTHRCHAVIWWTETAVRSQVEERSFQTVNSRHPAGARRVAGRESHHHGESPREGHTGQVITWWVQDPKSRNLPEMLVHGGWLGL
jgi:hypothetical protein